MMEIKFYITNTKRYTEPIFWHAHIDFDMRIGCNQNCITNDSYLLAYAELTKRIINSQTWPIILPMQNIF